MRRCQLCNMRWPDRFVQTLFTTHGNIAVDPICGLQEMRDIHGDPTLEFSGENNIELYQEALRLKKQEAQT